MPQKLFIFLKTPKNIEIQNFSPKQMTQAYVCMKYQSTPPPPPPPPPPPRSQPSHYVSKQLAVYKVVKIAYSTPVPNVSSLSLVPFLPWMQCYFFKV